MTRRASLCGPVTPSWRSMRLERARSSWSSAQRAPRNSSVASELARGLLLDTLLWEDRALAIIVPF